MRAALVAAVLLLAAPAGAAAAPALVPVGEFSDPVALAAPPRDPSRLFVVERGGIVRLVKDGVVAAGAVRRPDRAGAGGRRARAARHGVRSRLRQRPAWPTSS